MAKILIAPGRYVQDKGVIDHLPEKVKHLGTKFALIMGNTIHKSKGADIENSFKKSNLPVVSIKFGKECSNNEINRLIKASGDANVLLGIGGGKVIDAVKAAAYHMKVPVVIVPTVASTDAPCSALSVIYTDDGVFESYLVLPTNPNMVILDTQLIAQSPARLIVAGIGDALATYFEARACSRSGATALAGGQSTLAAKSLTELCLKVLMEDGLKAKIACENKVLTPAVENIIEANTLLSGLGFESGGLAAAHSIHNGFTALDESHNCYHGEKVAFGVLTQLMMENAPTDEIEEIMDFCHQLGLPITLTELGIKDISRERLAKVAELACAEGETIFNMPFHVDADSVLAAIIATDAMGKYFHENGAL